MKKGLLIALLALVIDQVHKYIMIYVVDMPNFMLNGAPVVGTGGKIIEVTSFFNLVMVWNKGVSFGMFNNEEVETYQPYALIALAVVILIALVFWLRKAVNQWQVISIGLVIGGALGNVVDRVLYGAVADFFDFHILGKHWPAFNIADSFICIGVIMLVIESFLDIKNVKKKNEKN